MLQPLSTSIYTRQFATEMIVGNELARYRNSYRDMMRAVLTGLVVNSMVWVESLSFDDGTFERERYQ